MLLKVISLLYRHIHLSQAIEEIKDKEVNGRILYCGRAQKKSERQAELRRRFHLQKMERNIQFQGVNLYIKNLEESIDDTRLRKEFESYGTITSAKVMRDEKGNSKGPTYVYNFFDVFFFTRRNYFNLSSFFLKMNNVFQVLGLFASSHLRKPQRLLQKKMVRLL